MTSIKIVYCLTDKSLGQSKEYVSYHPAWQAVCEKSKQFHKELEDSIYEIMEA
jgi:hypothetical protein